MKRKPYVIIGVVSILLSILFLISNNLPKGPITDFVKVITPLVFTQSLSTIISPKHDIVSLINLIISLILFISGVGTIFLKPFGRTFGYIFSYVMFIIITTTALLLLPKDLAILFRELGKNSIMEGMMKAAIQAYLILLTINLIYPIVLLSFYSKSNIKKLFFKES